VHRLDPRAKLVALALLVAASVVASGYLTSGLILLVVALAVALARLPARQAMATARPVLPLVGVLAVLQLLFGGASGVAGEGAAWTAEAWLQHTPLGFVRITSASIRLIVVLALRLVSLMILTVLLTTTTTPGALTMGVERLLRPLGALGLPSHEIALVGAIALRFLPILGEQMESIMLAQEARGVGQGAGGRWRLLANARRMAALVAPLFADVYRRAEEMGMAMLARCYHGGRCTHRGNGRTSLNALRYRPADAVAVGFSLLVLLAVIILQEAGAA
jgi:energy-coupling factor transport system permease protein